LVPGVFAFAGCTQHLADEIQSLVICVDYEEFGSLRATIGCNEGTPWPTQAARFPPKPSVKIQLDCQDVSRLLSRAQDESLPAGERARDTPAAAAASDLVRDLPQRRRAASVHPPRDGAAGQGRRAAAGVINAAARAGPAG